MKLYYVRDDAPTGDDRDLFVRATSTIEAYRYWCAYYENEDRNPAAIVIREVPPVEGPAGAISWDF